ncbi:hypothetical protein NK6_4360 [Bradyrhizobium diazoefficiens]|uniref:Uncharacterized protein n=1 Tax=Bradyrhizobium diazoefficiens TaxID=1355477 RepID=A0A0E4FTP5_9BRAD|nr:hypothetical protein NK6_4360 [Bradyrhizobium diazoefficiens]
MAAAGCVCEPIRDNVRAEARPPIKVPLSFHLDRQGTRFLEGCPANHARISRGPAGLPTRVALLPPLLTYVGSGPA